MIYFFIIMWYLVLYKISNVLVFCIVDNKNLQCVSVETPNHPLSPARLLLSNRGWAEPEPKLCARIEILVFVIFYQVDICSIQGRDQHPDKEHGLRLGKVQDQGELCIPWLDLVSWSCKGVQSQISRSAGALCSLLKMWHTWIVESRCHRLTILTIQGCRKWRS